MTLFRKKFRMESARKLGRDYAEPGKYFITICTKNFIPWFGKIQNDVMGLSHVGCVIADEMQKTSIVREFVSIDQWVVMPNHIHAIIVIHGNYSHGTVETHRRCVSTYVAELLPLCRRSPNSLGSIIAQFKSICTKRIRSMGYRKFAWQERFYDHVIRNERSLCKIQDYIFANPINWHRDRNFIDIK